MLEFQWDPAKAASNLQKHGVSFDYAGACSWTYVARMAWIGATTMVRSGGSPLESLRGESTS